MNIENIISASILIDKRNRLERHLEDGGLDLEFPYTGLPKQIDDSIYEDVCTYMKQRVRQATKKEVARLNQEIAKLGVEL